ncbi:MAG: VOC family protein, partial [Bdellovibrionales bacterium]|nr:VOC family protein [Bdellovibrionales bacterium]
MKLLHTMFRVSDLEESLHFYCNVLGLIEVDRKESQTGRFTLVYL